MIRAASFFILLFFCIAGQSFSSPAKVSVRGVVAQSVTRIPVSGAAIIQDYQAANGIMLKDSVFSDSQGRFESALLDSNWFSHLLTIEKDGWKTRTVQFTSPFDSQTVRLDTVFMVPYTQLDSVTYMVSGTVTDSGREGVRGAMVTILLTQNAAVLFSDTETASQWGGYFSAVCRQPYRPGPVTARIRVQAPGFDPEDMTRTLASSSPDFVMNPVMKAVSNAVSPAVLKRAKAAAAPAMTCLINGRKVETNTVRFGGIAVVRVPVSPGGTGNVCIRLK